MAIEKPYKIIYNRSEYGHGSWCVTAWHCELVTLHTSTESKHVWCFYDYKCTDLFHARPRGA